MANIKSAKKRVLIAEVRNARNKAIKSGVKTAVKKVEAAVAAGAGEHSIDAPMPGKIVKLVAAEGQAVKAGETLLILEAMKMQNEIAADADGVVKSFNVAAGQSVKAHESLVILG